MDAAIAAIAAAAALIVGAVVGFLARGLFANSAIQTAQEKSARIVAEARTQQKELILSAKDEKMGLLREAEVEARAKRAELTLLETRLLSRDEQLDMRSDMLEQRDRKLLDREREFEQSRQELARAQQDHVAALERVSGMSAAEAKAQLLEAVREEAERDAVRLAKSIEREAREEAEDRAREIVLTTMQRIAADHTAEHTVSTVHLPNDEMKGRIIGREGRNIRALEQATGVDLIIDD
ncbi:MAG TPA: Rnase Y domain-containing protein, partial [Candidatus Limnocylindrales bacterium]